MITITTRTLIGVPLVLMLGAGVARAQSETAPSTLRAYSTVQSIGIEWLITGDVNHNAAATVSYRVQGAATWIAALPLVRIDNASANMLAGSILFLAPGTTYEVTLVLSDPDGGADTQTLSIATRPLPSLPAGGRTLHVVPGTGGGAGSAQNPYRGIAAAQAAALPGDVVLLHQGSYGGRIRFDKPGAPGNYLVWMAAGDGEVLLSGIDIAASDVWLEGLSVRTQSYGILSVGAPENVVLRRNQFYGNHNSIFLREDGEGWYIADNTIVGDTPYSSGSLDGEGIELNVSSGHTVAHNSITNHRRRYRDNRRHGRRLQRRLGEGRRVAQVHDQRHGWRHVYAGSTRGVDRRRRDVSRHRERRRSYRPDRGSEHRRLADLDTGHEERDLAHRRHAGGGARPRRQRFNRLGRQFQLDTSAVIRRRART